MKYIKQILILGMILVLSACNGGDNADEITQQEETTEEIIEYNPVKGGSVNFAIRNPVTLNPLLNEEESVDMLLSLVYQSLFDVTADGRLKNTLLESYSFDETGKTITIYLNDDVYFHNGNRLTADDVIYSIDTLKSSSDNSTYKELGINITGYNKLNAATLTVTFANGGYKNLYYLTFPIVSKEHFSNKDNKLIAMGTGDYKFESFKTMKELVLLRLNPEAYVEKVIGVVTYDKETDLYTFNQQMIDVVFFDNLSLGKYAIAREYSKEDNDINHCEIIGFNFEKNLFKDVNLRKAIDMVTPKQEILEIYYLNNGLVANIPVNPKYFYSQVQNTHTYNLEDAYVLLKDNGYFVEDGVLTKGFTPVKFKILTNNENPQRKQVAERIKAELKNLSIDCEIEAVPFDQYMERISLRDYDIFIGGLKMSHIPDLSFALSSTSDKNLIAYKNATMDILLNEMHNSITEDEFLKTQKNLQEFIMKDMPYITLVFKNDAVIKGKNVVGSFNSIMTNPLQDFSKVYVTD